MTRTAPVVEVPGWREEHLVKRVLYFGDVSLKSWLIVRLQGCVLVVVVFGWSGCLSHVE